MNKPTAPPPLTCASRLVPANSTELEKLQYCKEAVDCSLATAIYNSQIATYNDHTNSTNKAIEAAWQEKFNLDIASKEKELRDERRDTKCGWGANAQWCKNDFGEAWEVDRYISCGGIIGDYLSCKRTVPYITGELENFKTSYTPKPVPEPTLQQNQSKININCCLNFMNIVGTATGIEQSCLATIDQLSEKLKEVETVQETEDIILEKKNITIEKNGNVKTITESKKADTQTMQYDSQKNNNQVISQPLNTVITSKSELPDWVIYVGIVISIIFTIFIGWSIYNTFFKSTTPKQSYSSSLQYQ